MTTIQANRIIERMLKEGYMVHTISAAISMSVPTVLRHIESEEHLVNAHRMGFQWRQENPVTSWPDYIRNGVLIGKKSKWFDLLPFAKKVEIPSHSVVSYFDCEDKINTFRHRNLI